jgi:hypothetical protein
MYTYHHARAIVKFLKFLTDTLADRRSVQSCSNRYPDSASLLFDKPSYYWRSRSPQVASFSVTGRHTTGESCRVVDGLSALTGQHRDFNVANYRHSQLDQT